MLTLVKKGRKRLGKYHLPLQDHVSVSLYMAGTKHRSLRTFVCQCDPLKMILRVGAIFCTSTYTKCHLSDSRRHILLDKPKHRSFSGNS
jgi:hypothetical protein